MKTETYADAIEVLKSTQDAHEDFARILPPVIKYLENQFQAVDMPRADEPAFVDSMRGTWRIVRQCWRAVLATDCPISKAHRFLNAAHECQYYHGLVDLASTVTGDLPIGEARANWCMQITSWRQDVMQYGNDAIREYIQLGCSGHIPFDEDINNAMQAR